MLPLMPHSFQPAGVNPAPGPAASPLGGGGQSPKASSWLGPSLGSPAPVLKGQGWHEEESSWMKPFHLCHLLLVLHGS